MAKGNACLAAGMGRREQSNPYEGVDATVWPCNGKERGRRRRSIDLVQRLTISYSILGRQSRCGGHDLGHGCGRPVQRMGMLIPLLNQLVQRCTKMIFGVKIYKAQALALEDTEPLFHLMHP